MNLQPSSFPRPLLDFCKSAFVTNYSKESSGGCGRRENSYTGNVDRGERKQL